MMVGEITLEPLTENTLEFIRQVRSNPEVYRWLFAHRAEISKDEQRLWWERQKAQGKSPRHFVGRCDGIPFGYAQLHRHESSNGAGVGVCVSPPFQGMGLGEKLLRRTIELGRNMGLTWFWLFVFANNERAVNLYHKCGFVELCANLPIFMGSNPSYPVRVMVRVL